MVDSVVHADSILQCIHSFLFCALRPYKHGLTITSSVRNSGNPSQSVNTRLFSRGDFY